MGPGRFQKRRPRPGGPTGISRNASLPFSVWSVTASLFSATRWTSETILNITSISELENNQRLPLFVTATCEFGRHDNPKAISGAEYLLLNNNGGAIGLVTTSRPVFSSTNFVLAHGLVRHVGYILLDKKRVRQS